MAPGSSTGRRVDEPGRAHRRPACGHDGPPVEVFAYTGTLAHERIEVEDVAVGVVRFENSISVSCMPPPPRLSARLQVHGDRGSVVIDNDKLTFIHLTPRDGSAEAGLRRAGHGDQPDPDCPSASGAAEQTAGSNPWSTGNDPHRRQYRISSPRLPGRRAASRPGDQPAIHRHHHRASTSQLHRPPGDPV